MHLLEQCAGLCRPLHAEVIVLIAVKVHLVLEQGEFGHDLMFPALHLALCVHVDALLLHPAAQRPHLIYSRQARQQGMEQLYRLTSIEANCIAMNLL